MPMPPFFSAQEHVLLVAVHVEPELAFAVSDLEVARKAGADGAILVNNSAGVGPSRLRATYDSVSNRHPGWFLGVNFLGPEPENALQFTPTNASALWFDDAKIDEGLGDYDAVGRLRNLRMKQLRSHRPLCFMPSVSMKYIGAKDDERVARLAAPYADILITSGDATGSAPNVEKIRRMAKVMPPEVPLAVASGVDINNVGELKQAGTRVFIVNTKICKPNTRDRIDPELATALAEKVHA